MKKVILLWMIALALISSTACQSDSRAINSDKAGSGIEQKYEENTGSKNQQKHPPFALYVNGKVSDDLYEKQALLKQKGQIFYIEISSEEALKNAISEYELLLLDERDSLSYGESFFKDNKMYLILPMQHSSSINYIVEEISQKETSLYVGLESYIPEIMTTDLVNKGVLVAVSREFIGSRTDFEVDLREVLIDMSKIKRDDLTVADLQLGNLKVRTAPEVVDMVMGAAPYTVVHKHQQVVARTYDGVEVTISFGEVSHILATSPTYGTPRGLRVGDSLERLTKLYGEPSQIIKESESVRGGDVYSFDLSENFYLFHAAVKDGKILSLEVHTTQ